MTTRQLLRTLFSALLFLAVHTAGAQGRASAALRGRILDTLTGRPLAGATLYLPEAATGTRSGPDGTYVLNRLPEGHLLIEVSHVGYGTEVLHLDLTGTVTRDFYLHPTITENAGVTVTGVAAATSIRQAPIPITLLRRAQLQAAPSTNLIDAVSRQPGLAQISTGPAISKPVIRGLGYNRVVVVNDGVRQEGQQWGDEHGIEIDEASVMRAEILKGPAALMYGSDALGGVLHFISHVPVAEGTVQGNAYSSYATNNRQLGLHASLSGRSGGGFNWNAYGSSKSAGDYRNRADGRVLNSRFGERNAGGYAGINRSWGYTHLIASVFHQRLGVVEGERDSTGTFLIFPESALERPAAGDDFDGRSPLTPFQEVRHYRAALDNSFAVGRSRLKANIGWQKNDRREFGNPEDLNERELQFDLRTLTYNLQWQLPERGAWRTTLGASGMVQGNENKGEEALIPDYGLTDGGAFLYTQRGSDRFTFTAGLRADGRQLRYERLEDGQSLEGPRTERNFFNLSGSAGLSFRPLDRLTLKLNAARGYRAPTVSELASNGAHEGTNRFEYGDPSLTSEKSLQLDAGLENDGEHFTFSLSGFYNRVGNFIFYRRLQSTGGGDSLLIVDGEELEAFRFAQGDAALAGLEVGLDVHPHPLDWLHFENSFSFVRGSFEEAIEGSRALPLMPAPRLLSELRADFQPGGALGRLYFRVEAERYFRQNRPFTGYGTETVTPGYTLLNGGIGADFQRAGHTRLSVHLIGTNLTDEIYQNHLSRLKYAAQNEQTGRRGVFAQGRNFILRVQVPFSF